jgi:hypothetical protein
VLQQSCNRAATELRAINQPQGLWLTQSKRRERRERGERGERVERERREGMINQPQGL